MLFGFAAVRTLEEAPRSIPPTVETLVPVVRPALSNRIVVIISSSFPNAPSVPLLRIFVVLYSARSNVSF